MQNITPLRNILKRVKTNPNNRNGKNCKKLPDTTSSCYPDPESEKKGLC